MSAFEVWALDLDGWRTVDGKLTGRYNVLRHTGGPVDATREISAVYRTEAEALAAAESVERPARIYPAPIAYLVIWVIVMQETGESSFYVVPCYGGDLDLDDRSVAGIFETEAEAKANADSKHAA